MPKTAKQYAAEARALVEQVKSMNLNGKIAGESGIDSGEKAAEARKIMTEATRLAGLAKKAKQDTNAAKAQELLAKFEGKGAHIDADPDLLDGRKFDAAEQKEVLVMEKSIAERLYGRKAAGGMKAANMKVLNESANSAGGYLVVPEYHQEMFAAVRLTGNSLRSLGWVSVHPTSSNKLLLPYGAGAVTMQWTGENDPSPSQDQAFGQFEVDVHEASGISKVSLSLFEDGDPSAMDLSVQELGKRAAILEEQAWLYGDGNGKAYGVLNTPGILTTSFTSATTAQGQIDLVLDMTQAVLTNYFAPVTGILVAPRRYAFWRKAKDSNNNYLFNMAGSTRAPGAVSPSPYDGGDILGVPVGISANIPTNLGGGTNEDRIIAADWTENHAWIRRDLTLDTNTQSDTAFANRQVHVRLTFRQGSTAQRQPLAFCVGGGNGLV